MICPKCKTKVSKDDAICPSCKLRLIFKCPRCGSPTRLGSVNCKKCGYTFVKFCPNCNSANYATSSVCRKCGAKLDKEKEKPTFKTTNKKIEITSQENTQGVVVEVNDKKSKSEKPLLFYINFINLERTFEKYNEEEFKQKVIQNIKTTVKIVFDKECEFINPSTIMFSFPYNKQIKILDKINQFEAEFIKFNNILEKTLDAGLSYKFAI